MFSMNFTDMQSKLRVTVILVGNVARSSEGEYSK